MYIYIHMNIYNVVNRAKTLNQWFLTFTNTPNPYVVFQAFVDTHFA